MQIQGEIVTAPHTILQFSTLIIRGLGFNTLQTTLLGIPQGALVCIWIGLGFVLTSHLMLTQAYHSLQRHFERPTSQELPYLSLHAIHDTNNRGFSRIPPCSSGCFCRTTDLLLPNWVVPSLVRFGIEFDHQ